MIGSIKVPAFEVYTDSEGKERVRERLVDSGIIMWSGTGTAGGDSFTSVAIGTIGVNNDGASDGNVYWYNQLGEWKDTGQTVLGLFGG